MLSPKYKIGIIGGGPAGLATAICLAEKGFEITLFEKNEFPVDKVCGEGIMPTGVEFLEKHGVMDLVDTNDKKEFYGVRYISDKAKILEGRFDSGYGFGIRRTVLSNALYKRADDFDSVQINENSELVNIVGNDRSAVIEISNNYEIKEYEFDFLIGCDGIRSKVRKLCGLENNKYLEYQRIGARIHYEIKPWSDVVEVYWKEHIEAYVTPVSPYSVQLAFLWDNKSVKPQSGYRLDKGLIDLYPELFERVKDCKELSRLKTVGPISAYSKKLYRNRIILLGDAYMYLDGITGEGISTAFKEAESLADSIFNHGHEFNKYYEKEVTKITNNYLRMTHLALLLSYYPFVRKTIFPLMSNKFFTHLLEVNMGRQRLFGLI